MKKFLCLLLACAFVLNVSGGGLHAAAKTLLLPPVNVSGTVKDEKGETLIGVTVRVEGAATGTVTDLHGVYHISVDDKATLTFTYTGYKQLSVPVNGQATLNITMTEETTMLKEVVAIGYGSQRKSELTGASSNVSAKEIAKRPLERVEQALQGTTPGVVVQSNSGQPGTGLSVRIRGANSITGSNEPLYVIDGYIGGNIESISPADIQSMEILKDASATAIYGSRASNGVVLITTKTGTTGKPKIDFNAWFSKAMIPKKLSLMNTYDFARTVNYQSTSAGSPAPFTDAQLQQFQSNPGTDWQAALQRKPWFRNYQVDVNGGNSDVNYYVSFNHLDQPGLIVNQWYNRSTLRANLGVKLNNKMDVKFNITTLLPKGRNTNYAGDLYDPFSLAFQWDPTTPVKNANGDYNLKSPYASKQINPVAQANNQFVDNSATNITGTGIFTYHILKGLTFTSNDSYETQSQLTQVLYGLQTNQGFSGQDYAQAINNYYRSYQSSNFFTYNAKIKDHAFTLTALYELKNSQGSNNNAQAKNLSSYSLGYYNLGLGKTQLTTSGYWQDALQSYMGRVNYSYKDKYLLNASIRTDGSSHLTDKYSTFPSVGAGWNIGRESFMKDSKVFSDLKIRASWGKTGNQAVPPYATIAQISSGGPAYYFDGSTPTITTPLGSPVSTDLKWEIATTTDAGLDASFLNGRLTLSVDAYHKKITDLLYNYQAPYYLGGGSYLRNIGSLENKGIEFQLGGTVIAGHKVNWTSNLNVSFNRNKVLDLGGLDNVLISNIGSTQQNISILKVGKPLGEFYGYEFLGTWKSNQAAQAAGFGAKPGDARYADLDGDGKITGADQTILGNGTPNYSFGFINDVTYGPFTLSVMVQGTHGNRILSGTIPYTLGGLGDTYNATSTTALNMWRPDNQTDIPAIGGTIYLNSSRFVYDASYVKFKNISLTYKVPPPVLSRMHITNLEVYVSGQNVFTITKYPGYDPEVTNATNALTAGLETGVIPNPRTYTLGFRLTL